MKKTILAIVSALISVFMVSSVFAGDVGYKDMIYLSDQSTIELNEKLYSYSKENPTLSEKELDVFLLENLQDYENEILKMKNRPMRGSLDYSWNETELRLGDKYPTQWNVYRTVSLWARNAALGIYIDSACFNPGVGDAFRHTYWNARLMTRFKEIFAWDVDKCLKQTKMWTDAHEEDGEPWGVDHEMDVLNNYAGRNIGYDYFNSSEGFLLKKTEYYVDNGWCWEIGEKNGKRVLVRTTNKDKR